MSASNLEPSDERLLCEGCDLERPLRSFTLMDESGDGDPCCDYCRKYGPPMEDPTDGLDAMEREAIRLLASGVKVRPVARRLGVNEKTLRKALDGSENKVFRAAFQRMMIDADLGPERLIRVMKEATDAVKHQWDPEQRDWLVTPDHKTRLTSSQQMLRVHGHEAPRALPEDQTSHGVSIIINTNLGGGQPQDIPGTLTARAPIDITPTKEEEPPDDGS